MKLSACNTVAEVKAVGTWYYRNDSTWRCASNNRCLLGHVESESFTDCYGAADEMSGDEAASLWESGMAEDGR